MVATALLLLSHVPPDIAWVSVAVVPAQMLVGPEIAVGAALTVTVVILRHPGVDNWYVMLTLPALTPVTRPAMVPAEPTVAMEVALLVHQPPDVALANVVIPPTHTSGFPVFAARAAFTVTVVTLRQPDPIVYVIEAVPAEMAVTNPVVLPIVATEVFPLVHTPPDVALASVEVPPGHKTKPPVIAIGSAPMFTVPMLAQP